jgi:hypothetical protein
MPGTFYGSDTGCLDDLPLISTEVTDPGVLIGQRLARRLQTANGALAFINDDPDGGLDIRQYVNARVTPNFRAQMEREIQAECLKDEEVQDCTVVANFEQSALTVTVSFTAASGPFRLVLNVRDLTVDVLLEQAA